MRHERSYESSFASSFVLNSKAAQLGLLLVNQNKEISTFLDWLRAKITKISQFRKMLIQQCFSNDKLDSSQFNPFNVIFPLDSSFPPHPYTSFALFLLPSSLLVFNPLFIILNCLISDISVECSNESIEMILDKPFVEILSLPFIVSHNPRIRQATQTPTHTQAIDGIG